MPASAVARRRSHSPVADRANQQCTSSPTAPAFAAYDRLCKVARHHRLQAGRLARRTADAVGAAERHPCDCALSVEPERQSARARSIRSRCGAALSRAALIACRPVRTVRRVLLRAGSEHGPTYLGFQSLASPAVAGCDALTGVEDAAGADDLAELASSSRSRRPSVRRESRTSAAGSRSSTLPRSSSAKLPETCVLYSRLSR